MSFRLHGTWQPSGARQTARAARRVRRRPNQVPLLDPPADRCPLDSQSLRRNFPHETKMSGLRQITRWMFADLPNDAGALSVIGWWEVRRIPYNIIVGIEALISIVLYSIFL